MLEVCVFFEVVPLSDFSVGGVQGGGGGYSLRMPLCWKFMYFFEDAPLVESCLPYVSSHAKRELPYAIQAFVVGYVRRLWSAN